MRKTSFPVYDADNHLYEPEEAFTRHLPKRFQRDFYFVDVEGRTKLVIAGMLSEFIPNPTFAVVAAPGSHVKWYRADNPEGHDAARALRQADPAARDVAHRRDGRIALLDEQGVHAALVFPTLASAIEERLGARGERSAALFHSLNQWTVDEWGFAREGRLFSVPFISLTERGPRAGRARVRDRERRARGRRSARRRCPTSAAAAPSASRSTTRSGRASPTPASSCACTPPTAATTASPSGGRAAGRGVPGVRAQPVPGDDGPARPGDLGLDRRADLPRRVRTPSPTCASPRSRTAPSGCRRCSTRLDRAHGQMPQAFKTHPREQFERHVYVAPVLRGRRRRAAKRTCRSSACSSAATFRIPKARPRRSTISTEFTSYAPDEIEKIFSTNLKGLLEGRAD